VDRARVVALAALTAVLVVLVDQAVKALVRGAIEPAQTRDVLGSTLRLVHVENHGVAFGRFSGNATVVGVLVALALGALIAYFVTHLDTPLVWLPTGLLIGGALGNVVDRLTLGPVTDYIKLPHWPAFNLADICITAGVVLLLIIAERDARRRERAPEPAPEAEHGPADRA
jgi:signal peptidase II